MADMTDERCARCGNPLPGARPDELDVCGPCGYIITLEVEVERLQPMQDGRHSYLSTYCLHGLHDRCRWCCKVCESPCRCDCHEAARERRQAEAGGT